MPYVQIKDVQIFYSDTGAGSETLVFSHGLLFNTHLFDHQLEGLSGQFRCIAYDHPGQGKSSMPEKAFTMDDLYAHAADFIESLDTGPVHFIGLSMGGFVAMRLAARRPDLIKSIILLDTSADAEPNALKYNALNAIVRLFGTKPVANTVLNIMFGQTFLHDPARKVELDKWRQHLIALPKAITRSVDAVIQRAGIFDEISTIACPTLVVCGEEDVATVPAKSRRIHAQIPGSVLTLLPKAGHSSSIEQPDMVNDAIRNFVHAL